MKISKECLEAIKEFEGFRGQAYKDPVGIWTIGYGHINGVKQGDKITKEQAEELLLSDVYEFEVYVNSLNLPLNQNQFDALVDFCFNLGPGNLSGSTLLKKIRLNVDDPSIEAEFKRWVHAGRKVLLGLVKRRQWEANRYFGRT